MTPMLETIATAIEAAMPEEGHYEFSDLARAALLGLRDAKWPEGRNQFSSLCWQGGVGEDEMVGAMIDAILSGGPG